LTGVTQLRTLGCPDLRDPNGRPLTPILAQAKRLALLTYLTLAGPSGYRRRDTVVALLWPELDAEHARGALRQALRFLRRALGEGVILTRGEEEIGVDRTMLWCDAVAFLAACEAGADAEALELYRGEFLDGVFVADAAPEFERWLDEQRAGLRRRAGVVAWARAEACKREGDRVGAVELARRAASLAVNDEADLARFVGFLDELGDRAGALRAYEEFARRLRQEHDALPAPETRAVMQGIRDRVGSPEATAPPVVAAAGTPPSAAHAPPAVTRPRLVALGVSALVVAALVTTWLWPERHTSTLAVFPLKNATTDSTVEYLADGITESVIRTLSRTPRLRVLAPSTAFRLKGRTADPVALGRELGVDAVVVWSAEELSGRLVLQVELVRTTDGHALWSEHFARPEPGLLAMEEEIAHAIAHGMRVRDGGEDQGRDVTRRSVDVEAYQWYLRGRYAWNKRDEAGTWAAIRLFERAIERDPTFALAYAGLADAYIILGHQSLAPPEEAYPRARAAALKALDIDSLLAEAHASLAVVRGRYEWRWAEKSRELERAIDLSPSYATARQWYAINLETLGRHAEAIASVRLAHELDPLSPMTGTSLGHRLYFAHRFPEAIAQYRLILGFHPDFIQAHLGLGWALLEQSEYERAIAEFARALALSDGRQGREPLAVAAARSGRPMEARRLLAQLHGLSSGVYVSPGALAEIYAALGEVDSAFVWLDEARRRHADEIALLRNNPRLDPLRADPRFTRLLDAVGLADVTGVAPPVGR